MTPRPRKKGSRDLPPNLEANKSKGRTYYRYRDPRTGKYHSLGKNRESAIRDAIALNNAIYSAIQKRTIEQLMQPSTPTLKRYAEHYLAMCKTRGQADNTLRSKKSTLNRLIKAFGNTPIGEITVRQIAELITDIHNKGKSRTAQAVRSSAIDLFKEAIHDGMIDTNPAAATRNPVAKVMRSRLTIEQFKLYIAATAGEDPWIRNIAMLALLTGQRREDLVGIKFRDVRDGYLHIVQTKTGTRLKLDSSLHLDAVGLSIADVISQCRDNVVSQYLIHHTRHRGGKRVPGIRVHKDTVSRKFKYCREKGGIEPETGKAPTTFHEIRSLAARLLAEQEGKEFAQALLGHKDARMTAVYRDSRGAEWNEVKSGRN
jgi:integrase